MAVERARSTPPGDLAGEVVGDHLGLPAREHARLGQRKKQWTQQRDIDAWLIWNIWQVANAGVAQMVALEKEFRIFRDAGVVVTQRGKQNPAAQSFVDFLKSADGRRIFTKWGWMAGRP